MRVRCDRGVQERPCEGAVRPRQPCASVPPFHFENLSKMHCWSLNLSRMLTLVIVLKNTINMVTIYMFTWLYGHCQTI